VTTINRNPHLIGQIAIAEGLITPEQLEECIGSQIPGVPGLALGEILVQKGYLSPEQLDRVIGIQRARFQRISADPGRGGLFGQIALRLGYITPEQLSECLREQVAGGASAPRIGEILLQKNYLSSVRFREVLHRQNREVAQCPKCGASYDVHGRYDSTTFVCSKCSTVIS